MEQITAKELAQWVINNRYPKSENEKVSDSEMYNHIIDSLASETKFAPIQLCPKCNGNGKIPCQFDNSVTETVCDVCSGAKTLTQMPVPVSEVGQMEEKDIQKLAFERYPVNEQGLVSGWEDINKDLREGFIEGLKMRLPVPNTKTPTQKLNDAEFAAELHSLLIEADQNPGMEFKEYYRKVMDLIKLHYDFSDTKTVEGVSDKDLFLLMGRFYFQLEGVEDGESDQVYRAYGKQLRDLFSSLRSNEPEREASNHWTKPCNCKEEDKHGESWCCNHCGRMTSNHTVPPLKALSEEKTLDDKLNGTGLFYDFPENKPLYKDSGLWQLRSDDMEDVVMCQKVNEPFEIFIERCKKEGGNNA